MAVAFTRKGVPKVVSLTSGATGIALTGLEDVDVVEIYTATPDGGAVVYLDNGATDGGSRPADAIPVAASALPVAIDVRGRGLAPALWATGANIDVVVVLR